MKHYNFTAQIEKDLETGMYIGKVPNLPGAHTQAKTLDKLNENLKEVIELCLENMTKKEISKLQQFVGFQKLSVAV